MLRKNNGSILIVSLIIFSLISTICLGCVSLVYSTISATNLEIKNLKLKEKSLSSIEIVYINMLNEIELAIDNSNNSEEFINYFKNDNFRKFILSCKNISKSNLSGVEVELINKTPFGESNKFDFQLKTVSSEGVYKKDILVNIEIKNPWLQLNLYEVNLKNELSIDDIKENFKNSNLITIYNYEEL